MNVFSDETTIDMKSSGHLLPEDLRVGVQAARNASSFAIPRRSGLFVGAAVLDDRDIWSAAGNIEVIWQHSYHAEENAIIAGLCRGAKKFRIIVVSAPRKLFTPCGHCCDLVMEYSTDDCLFAHDNPESEILTLIRAKSLMPFYPTRS